MRPGGWICEAVRSHLSPPPQSLLFQACLPGEEQRFSEPAEYTTAAKQHAQHFQALYQHSTIWSAPSKTSHVAPRVLLGSRRGMRGL